MDERTLDALKASIEKWERNAKVEKTEDAQTGRYDCRLCDLFRNSIPLCYGCPVEEKTGFQFCDDTPYWDAYKRKKADDIEGFRKAALAEVEFLKSLLPEGERDGPSP